MVVVVEALAHDQEGHSQVVLRVVRSVVVAPAEAVADGVDGPALDGVGHETGPIAQSHEPKTGHQAEDDGDNRVGHIGQPPQAAPVEPRDVGVEICDEGRRRAVAPGHAGTPACRS